MVSWVFLEQLPLECRKYEYLTSTRRKVYLIKANAGGGRGEEGDKTNWFNSIRTCYVSPHLRTEKRESLSGFDGFKLREDARSASQPL